MPYESNLNSISDMKNSEATKQPMLPDTSTCVADHNDELSKDSVIDYVRKTDENSVPNSCDRARAEAVRKHKSLKILKQQGNMKSKHFTRIKLPIQNMSEN